ncbi:hypothetical protein [Actinomycetospora succinea]|uniref:hypothetical protein n=1 Tax=Actinomycetospora succinea TaxID=663603 RepID=UPI00106076A0|nr:hypothetical protein [Actinomycetospora succinea]
MPDGEPACLVLMATGLFVLQAGTGAPVLWLILVAVVSVFLGERFDAAATAPYPVSEPDDHHRL